MLKFIIASLLVSTTAVAGGVCENYAKYGAIRAYAIESAPVQGTEGIQYTSRFIGRTNDVFEYIVTISDSNEDGETWDVDFQVLVTPKGRKCEVLSATADF